MSYHLSRGTYSLYYNIVYSFFLKGKIIFIEIQIQKGFKKSLFPKKYVFNFFCKMLDENIKKNSLFKLIKFKKLQDDLWQLFNVHMTHQTAVNTYNMADATLLWLYDLRANALHFPGNQVLNWLSNPVSQKLSSIGTKGDIYCKKIGRNINLSRCYPTHKKKEHVAENIFDLRFVCDFGKNQKKKHYC